MKKFLVGLLLVFFVGCAVNNMGTPTNKVEELLKKYKNEDSTIITQLEQALASESMTSLQKQRYQNLMKKQYSNMAYTIKNEKIDGDNAIVTVDVMVYDYATTNNAVNNYLENYPDEFHEGDLFNNEVFQDYRISELEKVTSRKTYTIDFTLTKKDGNWVADPLTEIERKKLHGVF